MTLAYPLSLAAFQDVLRLSQVSFDAPLRGSSLILGGGETLKTSLSPAAWTGAFTVAQQVNASAEAMAAVVRYLQAPDATFLLSPPHIPDIGIASAQINGSTAANVISFKAAGANKVLPAGTYFSFTYGSPTRYALHQLAETATANGSGVTGEVSIWPPLEPGWATNATVRFDRPLVKAKVEAMQTLSVVPVVSGGLSFSWAQTFR